MDLTEPDVRAIDPSATRCRPTAVRRAHGEFCVVEPATWQAIIEHAASTKTREVGGVVLGEVCVDETAVPYLLIDGHVAALEATSASASVTFTADAWAAIHAHIDRDRPGAAIVGWYHTHPNFGIFLSEMDLFIQRHFFNAPHQVAIVIDPVRNERGVFVWRDGNSTPEAIHVDEVAPIVVATPAVDRMSPRSIGIALTIAAAVVAAAVAIGGR